MGRIVSLALKDFPGWANGWAKPDRRPMYQWGREHLTMPPSYAIQGKFDVSITRPLIAVFDGIQNPLIRRVRFRKPPRFGGSMIADVAIPWIICNDPGPIMWNWQSDEDAKGHMKQKAWPLWKSCKPFRAMLPADRHDKTTTEIYFGPFFLVAQGANLNNLQAVGVRWLFNDETWLPVWQDLYQHAVYRTRDYERAGAYKICDVSQAGNVGDVEDRNWKTGQQAVWGYRDPRGALNPLTFGGKREDGTRWGLIWNKDAKGKDGSWNKARAIETARYVSLAGDQEWFDRPETIAAWNRDGGYVAQRTDNNPDTLSFAVNGLLNRSFSSLVDEKIDAMELAARGDMSAMQAWVQKSEVRPWEETHLSVTIQGSAGYSVADYEDGKPLPGEKYRTLMADRQDGIAGDTPHRWCEVSSWQADGGSKRLFYGRVDTKESMRELQLKYGVRDRCVWQDGNFQKQLVKEECAEYGWIMVHGSNTRSWPHMVQNPRRGEPPVKMNYPYSPWQQTEASGKIVHYLFFNEDYCSDILANLIAGRGLPFEYPNDVLPAYLEQLKGEHRVQKGGRMTWEKIHSSKPNHAFDTGKMGVCFALLMHLIALPKKSEEPKAEAAA